MTRLPLLAGLALAGSFVYSLAGAADLTGRATAIDGDTIVIGATHIRLAEVDAPERAQSCTDVGGRETPFRTPRAARMEI